MRLLTSLVVFLVSISAQAQDIHFSLYDYSPLTLNAGETGLFDGDWRITTNFRQQWKSVGKPFQTVAAAYDQQIYALPGQFSLGAIVLSDQSGVIDLVNNRVYISLGYVHHAALWSFGVGLQPGFVIKSYNLDGTSFPEQYNANIGRFDTSLPLSESGLSNQTTYFDLNFGLTATRKLESGSLKWGASMQHVNSPDVSFFDTKDRLSPRVNAYSQWSKNFKSALFIRPMVLFSSMNKAQEFVFGGDFGTYVQNSPNGVKEISVGLDLRSGFDRNADAFILSIGTHINQFRLGMAYDVNYSGLDQVTNSRGAIEISLIYISPSAAIKQIIIPCDRY